MYNSNIQNSINEKNQGKKKWKKENKSFSNFVSSSYFKITKMAGRVKSFHS